MRLLVYADLRYRCDGQRVSSSTAFITWMSALGAHVSELVVLGRTDPEPGSAEHALAGGNVRFVPLPYYESLRDLKAVLRAATTARRVASEEIRRCDAVLLFGPHPYSLVFGAQARRAGVPVVVGVRQDFPEYLRHRSLGWRRSSAVAFGRALELAHRRLGRGGGAIVVGDDVADRYRTRRVPVLVTGVSLVSEKEVAPEEGALERPWPGRRQLLVVGRLDPEKNPMLLVDVARLLRDGKWRIVVAGTGSLAERLTEALEHEGLGGVVELRGRLSRVDLRTLYDDSSALLHISLTEGQPQVLYEAAAMGLPIIATAVGGVASALGGGSRGALVPPNSARAITHALEELDDDSYRRSMVREAHAWASAATMESQTERVVEFISLNARDR